MLWIGIVSIVMFFAGLTSAYVVSQTRTDWLYFDIPSVFYLSTVIIILSSLTMFGAQWMIRQDKVKASTSFLLLTLGLGIAFTAMQVQGWLDLADQGIHFTGEGANVSGSFFVILVFAHAVHVLGGLISLIFTSIKGMMNKYSAKDYIGISVAATYWHFLDILWIYLILFLVFIR